MDQLDTMQRGINTEKIHQFYRNKGISAVTNCPVSDE